MSHISLYLGLSDLDVLLHFLHWVFINFSVPFYSSENLGSWFPCLDTPDVSWCCARGIWEPQPADETVDPPAMMNTQPQNMQNTCLTNSCCRLRLTAMLLLYVQITDSANAALVFFMLQSVSSSYTFNFNEQNLTARFTAWSRYPQWGNYLLEKDICPILDADCTPTSQLFLKKNLWVYIKLKSFCHYLFCISFIIGQTWATKRSTRILVSQLDISTFTVYPAVFFQKLFSIININVTNIIVRFKFKCKSQCS